MDPRPTLSLGLNRRRTRYSPVKIIAARRNVFELVTEGRYLNERMQREKSDFVSPATGRNTRRLKRSMFWQFISYFLFVRYLVEVCEAIDVFPLSDNKQNTRSAIWILNKLNF